MPQNCSFRSIVARLGLREIRGNVQITACRRRPLFAGKLSPWRGFEREVSLRHPNLDAPFRAFPDKADDLDRIEIHLFSPFSALFDWGTQSEWILLPKRGAAF